MRKSLMVCFLLLTVSLLTFGQQKKGKEVIVRGEIVDIQCYVSGAMGKGTGEDHLQCATDCAKGGIPLALLEDKTGIVYILGQTKTAMKGANDMLMDFIAAKVQVSGRLHEKGGVKLLLIAKISKTPEK
jgi:hypothetical protein